MSKDLNLVMVEHAAWRPSDGGHRRVFASPNGGRFLSTVNGRELTLVPLTPSGREPILDIFAVSNGLASDVPELAAALRGLGTVGRFRNASLWDAIGLAIIRQVIRAAQSKKMYRAFCAAHGEHVELPDGDSYALFPTPEDILSLDDKQFASLGMAFKRRPLMAAAQAYLDNGAEWREMLPGQLIEALQVVPRIGPWTAHAAVADWSNDWSFYPYTDLAVRTWAGRAAPSVGWPSEEGAFGRCWRALAADHLSSLTLLTLAWGSQHGDIG